MSNGLDIALMKESFGEWQPELGDHHTDIAFGDAQWGSFFFDTLKVTLVAYIEDEGDEKYTARYEAAFKESLKERPVHTPAGCGRSIRASISSEEPAKNPTILLET